MSYYDEASWLLVPSGIKEDVVFAQKPISGLGDLTFTRASDATYTDSTGVVRRSPYNLLQGSEDFNAWNKQQVNVSSNVAANPLTGVVNADLLVPDTTSNNHRIFNFGSVTSPSSNIMSVYAKAAGYNYISFGYGGGVAGGGIIFNLSNGTVSGSSSSYSGTISPAGDGWYLCSFIGNGQTNDYVTLSRWIVIRDNSTNLVFTGDGTSGVLVANAQLVEGNEALPYFPTTNRQDVPRIDFRNADGTLSSCGRLLLEPQRTNSIRNSSMVGAVAGTPGTAPTNWFINAPSGISTQVVGIGTENGLPYIDVRYFGTGTSLGNIVFEGSQIISASNGQTWTSSIYAKLVAGSAANCTISNRIAERNSAGGAIVEGLQTISLTSSLSRNSFTRTLSGGATVAFVIPAILLNFAIGTYDFTIRIAAPQMELGAYATTWVPTTTAAVTRLADSFSKSGVASLIGQTGGVIMMDFYYDVAFSTTNEILFINVGNPNNYIYRARIGSSGPNIFSLIYNSAGSAKVLSQNITLVPNNRYKIATVYNYATNTAKTFVNGVLNNTTVGTDPFPTLPQSVVSSGVSLGPAQLKLEGLYLSTEIFSDAAAIQLTTL